MRAAVANGRAALCALAALVALAGPARGQDAGGEAIDYSAPAAFPYFTSDPRGRAPGAFPADPAAYYRQMQTARAALRAGDCARAVALLESALEQYRDDGAAWLMLGRCRAEAGQAEAAAGALREALALGLDPLDPEAGANANDVMMRIGALYAAAGRREDALAWLSRGLDARFDERPAIAQAPEAAGLMADPAFAAIAGAPPEPAPLRDAQWRHDIDYLAAEIRRLHADPDHVASSGEINAALAGLRAAVPGLTDRQIAARLALIVGGLGGGHDLMFAAGPARGALPAFDLDVYVFADGLFVMRAGEDGLAGARIDAFGDTPAEEALAIARAAFPGDNAMQARWLAPRRLTLPDMLEALGVVEDAADARLRVTRRDGTQATVAPRTVAQAPGGAALVPPPGVAAPLYLSRPDAPFWMTRLEDPEALYVQINAIADGPEESFADFTARLRAALAAPQTRRAILDLRHSAGGDGALATRLVRTLIHFSQEPDAPETGALFVLIGRNTFSASQNIATDLDRLAGAVFVGEPTGSRPNALAEAGRFRLPYSGLGGLLSSQLHQHAMPEDHRIWIAPDIPAALDSGAYFAGRDPAMEAVRAVISAPP